jgi:hypothetical protein
MEGTWFVYLAKRSGNKIDAESVGRNSVSVACDPVDSGGSCEVSC